MSKHHHLKYVKQQYRDRKLVAAIVELVAKNDHDSLAYIARTCGVPPQLRYVVWPILLKYHPMCISPNIMSNTVVWDPVTASYHLTNPDQKNSDAMLDEVSANSSGSEDTDSDFTAQMEKVVVRDLKKYFLTRVAPPPSSQATSSTSSSSTLETMPTLANEHEIIETLKDAILKFLNKWSRIFKYEIGLTWIALGLAEWYPCLLPPQFDNNDDNFIVLSGRRHVHMSNGSNSTLNSNSLSYLFSEYPLPSQIRDKLPTKTIFSFDQLYERLALVLLHSPDTAIEQRKIKRDFPQDSMHITHYFPVLSGGDLSFRTQIFFKVFSSILPELYQPLTEEINLQPNSSRTSWLYWWFKCSGARALQRQDRGRIWDLFLGWRPTPNKNSINFYLNYNTKSFSHLYNKTPAICKNEIWNEIEHNDTFWFPDLDTIPLGTPPYTHDVTIIKELLRRNQYDEQVGTIDGNHQQPNHEQQISFSIISPHTQLIFIYVAIMQFNEFKLLEFEETEIAEFLNNVPMLSKADDMRFRKLFDNGNTIDNQMSHEEISKRPSTSSNPHMLIEVGNDGKSSHSFNDLMKMTGDIWRKWLWRELEESLNND